MDVITIDRKNEGGLEYIMTFGESQQYDDCCLVGCDSWSGRSLPFCINMLPPLGQLSDLVVDMLS